MAAHRFAGGDGQQLAADLYGPDAGTPVLLIGGLGQTRHSWQRAAMMIAANGRRAITMDIRGHGDSDRAPDDDYTYARHAADIVAVVAQIGRPVVMAGNSLGGKIALASAAICGPSVVTALAMVDAVPHSRPEGIRQIAGSMQLAVTGFASPDEAAAQIAAARGLPLAPDAGQRLARNMRRDANGRWHWHWDPSYRDPRHKLGLGPGTELLDQLASQLSVPALLAWCELSEIVTAEGVAALKDLIAHLEVEIIPGARHTIVGDQNDLFADTLLRFLARNAV